MIWKTTVQCGSLFSYVLSSFTLNFALFKKDKSRIQAPESHMQCTFYSCPISAKQKYWILIGKKYIVSHLFDAPHPIDQSNKCNIFCSTHRTQSISAHFKCWILIGKKYILFPFVRRTAPNRSVQQMHRRTTPNRSVHTSNGGFWLVKNILFPICLTHPNTQLFCWLWIGQRALLWQPPTFLWTDRQKMVDFLTNLQR